MYKYRCSTSTPSQFDVMRPFRVKRFCNINVRLPIDTDFGLLHKNAVRDQLRFLNTSRVRYNDSLRRRGRDLRTRPLEERLLGWQDEASWPRLDRITIIEDDGTVLGSADDEQVRRCIGGLWRLNRRSGFHGCLALYLQGLREEFEDRHLKVRA